MFSIKCFPILIPAFLLKDCSSVYVKALTVIFNLILRTSCFPRFGIYPVHKRGNKNDHTNYRPITLVCNFGKILEFLLHSAVHSHVSELLSSDQHGFIKGRSTVTNLVCKTQFICEKLEHQRQVDVIYTDFSAFDRLDHGILLQFIKLDGSVSRLNEVVCRLCVR